jgi:hypothetical protein
MAAIRSPVSILVLEGWPRVRSLAKVWVRAELRNTITRAVLFGVGRILVVRG